MNNENQLNNEHLLYHIQKGYPYTIEGIKIQSFIPQNNMQEIPMIVV